MREREIEGERERERERVGQRVSEREAPLILNAAHLRPLLSAPGAERDPVVAVGGHGEEGLPEPARTRGTGDLQPGVVAGERVRGGGGGRRR